MGLYKRTFDPLDLEIIDRVYDAAWAKIEAEDLFRDVSQDDERKQSLRERIFALAPAGHVDFDTLYETVMGSVPEPWAIPPVKKRRSSPPEVARKRLARQDVRWARRLPRRCGPTG